MGRTAKTDVFIDTDVEVSGGANEEQGGSLLTPFAADEEIEIIPMSFEPTPAVQKKDDEKKPDTGGDEDEEDDEGKGGEGSSQEDDDEGEDQNAPKGKTEKNASPDSSSSSPYLAFAKVLYEGGALTQLDEEEFLEIAEKEGELAAIVEFNKRTISDIVQMEFDKLPPDYKRLIDAARRGVPLKDAFEIKTSETELSKITEKNLEEDEDLAKDIIRKSYKIRGFDNEETEQEIKDAEEINKLGPKAKAALKHLVGYNKQREKEASERAERDAAKAEERRLNSLKQIKSTVENMDKVLPGVKLSKVESERLYSILTEPAGHDPNSGAVLNEIWMERAKSPEKFDAIMAYMYSKGVFSGKMDSFVKKAKSEAISQLDTLIKSGVSLKGGKPVTHAPNPKKEEIAKSLSVFRRTPMQ